MYINIILLFARYNFLAVTQVILNTGHFDRKEKCRTHSKTKLGTTNFILLSHVHYSTLSVGGPRVQAYGPCGILELSGKLKSPAVKQYHTNKCCITSLVL